MEGKASENTENSDLYNLFLVLPTSDKENTAEENNNKIPEEDSVLSSTCMEGQTGPCDKCGRVVIDENNVIVTDTLASKKE